MTKHIVPGAESSVQLSVLIVSYNSIQTIQACVESVFSELDTMSGEVIVVDNFSTDGTPELLKTMAVENSQLQIVLNRSNRGFAVGNNQALALANGHDILILNPDTVVQAGTLLEMLKELNLSEKIGIVAPQLKFPDGRIQKTCRRFPRHLDVIYHSLGLAQLYPKSTHFNAWKMGDFDHKIRRQVDQPAGAALLVKGHLLRELNGFDENFPMFFNDVDLCKRVTDAGYEIWFLPEYIVEHVGGASVKQVKVKMTISSHVSFFRYFEKHFTRLHQQPNNFLIGILLYLSLIPRILAIVLSGNKSDTKRDTL